MKRGIVIGSVATVLAGITALAVYLFGRTTKYEEISINRDFQ